jgi:hypothetical protein
MPVRIQVPNPPPSLSDLELVYGRPVVDTFMQTNEYIGSDCFATVEAVNPTGDESAAVDAWATTIGEDTPEEITAKIEALP